jgi:hypothetical protein
VDPAIGPSGGRLDLVPERKVILATTIRATKAEALPVKKPKKPKVNSSSAIQKDRIGTYRRCRKSQYKILRSRCHKQIQQASTAGQRPQDQEMKNPPKHWSLMKRAAVVVVAVVGLIAPKRPKGP